MTDHNNQPTPPPTSSIVPFLHQVLSSFQDPLYNPETDNYKPMASILWNLDIFRRNFQNLTDLTDFIELAKKNFTYEVHPYGSVLMKEHEFADKFCLVLQGTLQKLQQRPYQDVEQDIRNSPRRKTFRMQESQDDSFTQSSYLFPRNNILMRKPNASLLNNTSHKLSIDHSQAVDSPKHRFKREQSRASLKNEDPVKILPPSAGGESSPRSPRRVSIRLSPFSGFAEALESPDIPRLGTIGKQLSKNLIKPNKQIFNLRESLQRTGTATSWTTNLQQSPSLKANGRNSSVGHNESPENLKSWIKDEDEMIAENNNENLAFIKHIVSKSPEIKQRCFTMGAVRVRCTRTYQPGDYFGENFFKQHQFKENYIIAVASEEVHLAVMSREDYKSIIDELASRPNNKLQFFQKVFPSFEEDCVNRFSQYFYKRRFEKGETIYSQGEPATNLFLLQDGDVRLFKETQLPVKKHLDATSSPTHPQIIELPIASITKGQFFGEEMLLNEPERLFTATSSVSNTIVYYLDPKGYKKLRGKYEDFLEILRDQAKNRFLWRKNRVAELSSQYKMTSDHSRKSSLLLDEQLPSITSTLQKTTTQGFEKLSKRLSRRTSTGLNLSLTQYLGENTVWATSKTTSSTRGKTSMRDQVENPEKDLAEMAKSSGLYKARFSRKTLSVAALGGEEVVAMKNKSENPKNMLGRLGDSLKRSLVDLHTRKNSIIQANSPHHIAKQLTGNLGNLSPKISPQNESPNSSPTHSPKLRKRMSMSMEMNNEQAKGFPTVPLAVIKKEQIEGNVSTVKIVKRKSQNNMTTMSFFSGVIKGSNTPKTPKIPLALGYPEAGVYELSLGKGFHSRSTGTLVNYMEDSPMNKDEGVNQWKGSGENKKLKKILHLVNYHTGGHASREGTRRDEGEKEFVNIHMQAMKKKAYNLIRVSDR